MWRYVVRIGKGEGFADLEWALGASNHGGAVSKNTLVATTVHDCQGCTNFSVIYSFYIVQQTFSQIVGVLNYETIQF